MRPKLRQDYPKPINRVESVTGDNAGVELVDSGRANYSRPYPRIDTNHHFLAGVPLEPSIPPLLCRRISLQVIQTFPHIDSSTVSRNLNGSSGMVLLCFKVNYTHAKKYVWPTGEV